MGLVSGIMDLKQQVRFVYIFDHQMPYWIFSNNEHASGCRDDHVARHLSIHDIKKGMSDPHSGLALGNRKTIDLVELAYQHCKFALSQ